MVVILTNIYFLTILPCAVLEKTGKMDPWGERQSNVTCLDLKISLKFEDNFCPLVRDTLPDSADYLASLEEKLKRLKNDPDVLKQLSEKREACMQQLLCNATVYERDEIEESINLPIINSQLMRAVLPHRQALNQCELFELLKYDQLNDLCSPSEGVKDNTNNHTP